MKKDDTWKPRVKKHIVFREEDEGAFLFDPLTDELRCLNQSASLIFPLLDGRHCVGDILRKLEKAYSRKDTEGLRQDLISFWDALAERGLTEND